MGGIVEEFIEAAEKQSPSAQLRISPRGEVITISTHDQILGGPSGQMFLGCRFPARDDYRLEDPGGRRGASATCWPRTASSAASASTSWRAPERARRALADTALEINLRMGGTTHPYLALQFLTGGAPRHGDRACSCRSSGQREVLPRHRQPATPSAIAGLLPEDLVDILTINKLHYSHRTESGVLFHLIGALSEFGKLGLTAIGNDDDEVAGIYDKAIEVLDLEASMGHAPSGHPWPTATSVG